MPVNLKALAQKLVKENATTVRAIEALAARIAKDTDLRRVVAGHILGHYAPAHSRSNGGPHRRRPDQRVLPTAEQKRGALMADRIFAADVFQRKLRGGRVLGDVQVGELRKMAEAARETMKDHIQRGYEDAVDAIACVNLEQQCDVASDPFAKVRDVIKPTVATKIYEQAQIRAAKALRDTSAKLTRKLIAAAQLPPPDKTRKLG